MQLTIIQASMHARHCRALTRPPGAHYGCRYAQAKKYACRFYRRSVVAAPRNSGARSRVECRWPRSRWLRFLFSNGIPWLLHAGGSRAGSALQERASLLQRLDPASPTPHDAPFLWEKRGLEVGRGAALITGVLAIGKTRHLLSKVRTVVALYAA